VGFKVRVIASHVDETPLEGEDPYDMVVRLALLKVKAVALPADCLDYPVVAADTTVFCDNRILGKPVDEEDAMNILHFLSGKEQEVITGFAIKEGKHEHAAYVSTRLQFRHLSELTIKRYVASGECFDKAGAYGIQGHGAALISTITGSYTNVVGLPLEEVLLALGVVPGSIIS
jgi:nucleoside triphosphate pyrophosphatase